MCLLLSSSYKTGVAAGRQAACLCLPLIGVLCVHSAVTVCATRSMHTLPLLSLWQPLTPFLHRSLIPTVRQSICIYCIIGSLQKRLSKEKVTDASCCADMKTQSAVSKMFWTRKQSVCVCRGTQMGSWCKHLLRELSHFGVWVEGGGGERGKCLIPLPCSRGHEVYSWFAFVGYICWLQEM